MKRGKVGKGQSPEGWPVRKRDLFAVPGHIVQTAHGPATIEAQQPVLRCACSTFSANPADYWNRADDAVFHCDDCGEDMALGYVRHVWEPIRLRCHKPHATPGGCILHAGHLGVCHGHGLAPDHDDRSAL